MASYWFVDWQRLSPGDQEAARVEVKCGSNFAAPIGRGFGRCDFVQVFDYGEGRAPLGLYGASWREVSGSGAVRVFHHPGGPALPSAQPDGETWGAVVDRRFHVQASSAALLEHALQRGATLPQLLSFAPDLTPLAADSCQVLVCRPRPATAAWLAGESPGGISGPPLTAAVVAQVHCEPTAFEVWSDEPQPAVSRFLGVEGAVESAPAGSRWRLRRPCSELDLVLLLHLLYGDQLSR